MPADALALEGVVDKVTFAGREAYYRVRLDEGPQILAHVHRPERRLLEHDRRARALDPAARAPSRVRSGDGTAHRAPRHEPSLAVRFLVGRPGRGFRHRCGTDGLAARQHFHGQRDRQSLGRADPRQLCPDTGPPCVSGGADQQPDRRRRRDGSARCCSAFRSPC